MRATREIAGKALDHLRRMVPCAGASVIVFDRNSSAHRLLASGTCVATNFVPRAHSVASYEGRRYAMPAPARPFCWAT